MDLQKDEDFEKAWQENRHIWESTKNLAKAMFYAGQAKAQADQKIKLLLCDEHLKKCESPTGIFNSQYPDEEPCLICLAKQYKAQAVPEGFVLVSKDNLSVFWQDSDEPENFCSFESDFDDLGDCIELGDIMEINKHTQAHIQTEKLFGTWFAEAIDPLEKANFFVGTHEECMAIVEKNKTMIEAREQSHE